MFQGVSTTTDGKTTATNLSPVSQRLAEKLLELAFQLGVKVSKNIYVTLRYFPVTLVSYVNDRHEVNIVRMLSFRAVRDVLWLLLMTGFVK